MALSGKKPTLEPKRTDSEAWELAMKNEKLIYSTVYRFLKTHQSDWYSYDAMFDELTSHAWEAAFKASRLYDAQKAKLSSYLVRSINNALLKAYGKMLAVGYTNMGSEYEKRYIRVKSFDALIEENKDVQNTY